MMLRLFQPLLPMLHAGHTHSLREKLVDMIGVLGILLLFMGVIVIPVGAWVYAKIAAILLSTKAQDQGAGQVSPSPIQAGENPTPPAG